MKISFWIDTEWAFGRIAQALKKYSKHQIDIYSWHKPTDGNEFRNYDLVYIPVWGIQQLFHRWYPSIKTPIAFSMHGVAELFNWNLETLTHRPINSNQVEHCCIPKEVQNVLNSQHVVSCVSRELIDLLRPQTSCSLMYTPCGVDLDTFYKPFKTHKNLTVICPTKPEFQDTYISCTTHGYDVKRWHLVKKIQELLPNIEFKFLPKRLALDEMPEFYYQGNVILCLSHSEGGPLGILEAGAMGVVPISTPVGITPEVIIPNFNGRLLASQTENDLVDEVVYTLQRWDNISQMQRNIQETILASRSWEYVISSWDKFFEEAVKNEN